MNYYLDCLKTKYFCFSGRARRKEYWMFALVNFVITLVLGFIDQKFTGGILQFVYGIAVLLPCLGVCVRRLHDIGKTGWWLLICLVPIVGPIVFLVFMCLDSKPGTNEYGPNPKGL